MNHVSGTEYSKLVRQEIKKRFEDINRIKEGAVVLTYSTDAIVNAEVQKLTVSECADWFIHRSNAGYALT